MSDHTLPDVMAHLVGDGLVQLGKVIVNPAHVTHLLIVRSKYVSFAG